MESPPEPSAGSSDLFDRIRSQLDELFRASPSQQAGSGGGEPFADPIPASALKKISGEQRWIWEGGLARGCVTLFSALWKAGKSTLLAHVVRSMQADGWFCERRVKAGKVLYVTEEHESLWADRRDDLGIGDHVRFQVRPFAAKPRWDRWLEFLCHLKGVRGDWPYDLLVLDTISNLWPVRDENDATQVQSALMPLNTFGDEVAVLVAHHLRKADGQEATGSRGSGALPAFVDIILELRRYQATDRKDRRRVLSGYGRFVEVPEEEVFELTPSRGYVSTGSKQETAEQDLLAIVLHLLPHQSPGHTYADLVEAWPQDTTPRKKRLLDVLHDGLTRGLIRREGRGCKGDPFGWFLSGDTANGSVPVPSPRGGTETADETVNVDPGDATCF